MRTRVSNRPTLVGVLLLVALLAGFAGYRVGAARTGDAGPGPSDGALVTPVTLKPQPVDVGFAADMIDHHDQAVQLALLTLDRATTQPVRAMALKIATDQRRESGMLQQFLRDRGVTYVDPQRTVMAWMGEPTPHDRMPGLATREQVLALTDAQGAEVDRLFVELMITHHEGGVHMARYAAAHAETQDLRDLAARMVVAQEGELNDLHQLQPPPG